MKDPDMCGCVKNWVDDIVDAVWPEIVEEARYQLRIKTHAPEVEVS
jgi:hypothetical protein